MALRHIQSFRLTLGSIVLCLLSLYPPPAQIRDISDPIDKVDFTKAALCALVNGDVIIVSAGSPSVTASGTCILK